MEKEDLKAAYKEGEVRQSLQTVVDRVTILNTGLNSEKWALTSASQNKLFSAKDDVQLCNKFELLVRMVHHGELDRIFLSYLVR